MKTALIASLALPFASAEDGEEPAAEVELFSVPDTKGAAFVETFQTDPFETGRWSKSSDSSYEGQEWTFGAPDGVDGKYKDDTVSYPSTGGLFSFPLYIHSFCGDNTCAGRS